MTVSEINTTEAVAEDEGDTIEYLDSGRIRAVLDGKRYTLRLPKLGEYKKLRQRLADMQEDEARRQDEGTPTTDSVVGLEEFMDAAFDQLGDSPLPPDHDDWPAWLPTFNTVGRMLSHWRAVPLAPGRKGS